MIDRPLLHKNLITNIVLTTYVIGPRAHIVRSWYVLALTLLFPISRIVVRVRLPRFSNNPLIGDFYFGSLFPKRGAGWKTVRMTKHIHFFLSLFTFFCCYSNASYTFFRDFRVYIRVNNSHLSKSKSLHTYRLISCAVGQRGGKSFF